MLAAAAPDIQAAVIDAALVVSGAVASLPAAPTAAVSAAMAAVASVASVVIAASLAAAVLADVWPSLFWDTLLG